MTCFSIPNLTSTRQQPGFQPLLAEAKKALEKYRAALTGRTSSAQHDYNAVAGLPCGVTYPLTETGVGFRFHQGELAGGAPGWKGPHQKQSQLPMVFGSGVPVRT